MKVSSVPINDQVEDPFQTTVRVRQGCLLSQFNIFLKKIMQNLLLDHHTSVSITCATFALQTSTWWQTNRLIYGMEIITDKSKVLVNIADHDKAEYSSNPIEAESIQAFKTKCLMKLLQASYQEHQRNQRIRSPPCGSCGNPVSNRKKGASWSGSAISPGTTPVGGRCRGRQGKTWMAIMTVCVSCSTQDLICLIPPRTVVGGASWSLLCLVPSSPLPPTTCISGKQLIPVKRRMIMMKNVVKT